MKTVYYVAASLDGYIADAADGVEWLDRVDIDQQATGYEAFFDAVDGLLMGRKTFDFVYDHGTWPYGAKPTWVCSHRAVPHLDGCNLQNARSPDAAIREAQRQGITTLWVVGGGQLANTLIRNRQLTHISIAVMPVLLGAGTPLVGFVPNHLYLRQEHSTPRRGFTQIEYEIVSSSCPA